MIERRIPAWFPKAKEIAARVASPAGKPFAAAKKQKKCTLHLYDAIGKDPWSDTGISPEDVITALKEAGDADELEIHVNSPGGYVFDGIAIYNAIRGFKGTKTVYVDGLAASIASIIALAGDRVVTNEGAMWMVHDPAGGIFSFGTADQIEEDARKTVSALRKVRENLIDIYVAATGQSASQVSAWMSAETWMTATEAKERGFTDEVADANAMGCECDGECGGDCPCGGECTSECECPAAQDEAGGGEHEKRHPKKNSAPARAKTAAELIAEARAVRADLKNRFPAASRGQQSPGQPGATNDTKPGNRQEQKR